MFHAHVVDAVVGMDRRHGEVTCKDKDSGVSEYLRKLRW